MHLEFLDFVVMGIYFSGLLLVGVYFARKQTDRASYFLGNRKMPWFIIGISVLATLLSSVTYLAVPGEMIRYGIGFGASLLSFLIIVPVLNYVLIPFLKELPFTSVYEFLENRFNIQTRMVAATSFVISRLIWAGLIIYMTSFAVSAMTGWSMVALIVGLGLFTTLYTSAGGFSAVIWTDFIQFVILFLGALFVPFYVMFVTGGGMGEWWGTFSQAGRAEVPVFSLDPEVRLTVVGIIVVSALWNICTHGADQVAAQRYLSTPSLKAARRSVWIFAAANILLILFLMVTGLALFYYFYQESDLSIIEFQQVIAPRADEVFPEFIATRLPAGLSGIILAALLAAAMSSLSSAINSISSVVVTDFFDRFDRFKRYRDHLYLPIIFAALTGFFGILSALGIFYIMRNSSWNLLELTERGNHLFVAPLGVLFFVGILIPRVGGKAALCGFFAGLATSTSISFSQELFGLEQRLGFIWILPGAVAISFLVSWLASYPFPRKPDEVFSSEGNASSRPTGDS